MAPEYPEGFDEQRLRENVRAVYGRLARDPQEAFPMNRGVRYAARRLNYAAADLALVPPVAGLRFAGAGNPHRIGPVLPGDVVLDHGCGSGTDLVIAAHRAGSRGRAIGVDITAPMLECAWEAARLAGVDAWATLHLAGCEDLPADDDSVDVLISNGVLHLAADKRRVFAEIVRVLKPGGRLYLADVVVQRKAADERRAVPEAWTQCLAGALPETELLDAALSAGLINGQVTERFDCLRDCSVLYRLAPDSGAGGVNFLARKSRRKLRAPR